MRPILLMTFLMVATLAGCGSPKAKSCTTTAQCPTDSICVQGICQKGVPGGGTAGLSAGSARMTAGTKTMDVTLGQPVTPGGAAATKTLEPAENNR